MKSGSIESRLREYFAANGEGVAAVYLFGSVARDRARADSDVDVGVLFTEAPSKTYPSRGLILEGELEGRLRRVVQVVTMNEAPVDLAIRVLRAETLLYEGDRSARIRFEVRLRNEFFDLEPHLRRYRCQEATS